MRLLTLSPLHVGGGAALLIAALLINVAGFRRSVKERGTRLRVQTVTGSVPR